uniref:MRG domain-containing protein n=1 Tax=Mesocestoides corti TaxID=53468 RepID=A0A5K3FMA8_MESCO
MLTGKRCLAIAPAVEQLPPSSDSYEEPEERDADAIAHSKFENLEAAGAYAKTDRSRRICAEFCSSVRILFDALLVEYLLYPNEDRKRAPFGKEGQVIPQGDPFTIIPLEEIQRNPSYPCLIYESVYILRLIVRLPALVNQMALTRCRRSIVLRHLYLFVAYLDQTKDFWFTSTPPSTPGPTIEPLTPDDASRIKRIRNASAASSGSSTHQTSISKIRSGAKIVPRRVTVPRLRGASRKRPTPELRTHSTSSTIHLLFVMLEFRFIRWRHCIVLPQHRVWYF